MKLKELFQDPAKWAQNWAALDKNGHVVIYNSEEAFSFCLLGGALKCYGEKGKDEILEKIKLELGLNCIYDCVVWQDKKERIHKEILDLVTKLDI